MTKKLQTQNFISILDGGTGEWMEGQTDGQTDKWTDKSKDRLTKQRTYVIMNDFTSI